MAESQKIPEESGSPQPPPASPAKRVIAWVGVAYMAMLVLLNLYPFFRQGAYLTGVFPLFVCPGAIGMAAISFLQARRPGGARGKRVLWILLAVICLGVCVKGLMDSLPPLWAGLGGGL